MVIANLTVDSYRKLISNISNENIVEQYGVTVLDKWENTELTIFLQTTLVSE